MSRNINLNHVETENDGNYSDTKFSDNSTMSSDGGVSVYFRGLDDKLIEHINASDAVFGCVAWLTHPRILDALAEKNVAIVVQKEDFLRPDSLDSSSFKKNLRSKYNALSCDISRYDFKNMISKLSTSSDPSMEAVRCVGNINSAKNPAFPRMHNKFLIFARVESRSGSFIPTPYAVWTGSFNMTHNATNSLENALYLTSPELVAAYFQEYGQIMAISEPLDWESEWCAPEHRIGT